MNANMTNSEKAEKFMREHMARHKDIGRKSLLSCGALGKINIEQIFRMSNAKVHPDVQFDESKMEAVMNHIDETGEKDVVNGS